MQFVIQTFHSAKFVKNYLQWSFSGVHTMIHASHVSSWQCPSPNFGPGCRNSPQTINIFSWFTFGKTLWLLMHKILYEARNISLIIKMVVQWLCFVRWTETVLAVDGNCQGGSKTVQPRIVIKNVTTYKTLAENLKLTYQNKGSYLVSYIL